jgi:hypothetical protein
MQASALPLVTTRGPVLIALGAAVGLHVLLLLWGFPAATPGRSQAQTQAAPHLVWRWLAPAPQAESTTATRTVQRELHHPSVATPPSRAATPTSNAPTTHPVHTTNMGTSGDTTNLVSPAGASDPIVDAPSDAIPNSASGSNALDLRLPAPALRGFTTPHVRSQALNDGRSNTRPRSLEQDIAAATTGNDGLLVEDRGLGRKRVRTSGRCVDVHQARIAQIDAMNEVSARVMPGLKSCD